MPKIAWVHWDVQLMQSAEFRCPPRSAVENEVRGWSSPTRWESIRLPRVGQHYGPVAVARWRFWWVVLLWTQRKAHWQRSNNMNRCTDVDGWWFVDVRRKTCGTSEQPSNCTVKMWYKDASGINSLSTSFWSVYFLVTSPPQTQKKYDYPDYQLKHDVYGCDFNHPQSW